MAKEQKIQGGTSAEQLEIAKQYVEETEKAKAEAEVIEEKKKKVEDRVKKTVKESQALKEKTKAYRERGTKEKPSPEKKEAELERYDMQRLTDQANRLNKTAAVFEAQGKLKGMITAQLIDAYRSARGEITPMPVSTEALRNKLSNPPEMQEAPKLDPQAGKVIAQLATSIIAGFGPRHAGVVAPTSVGIDTTAQGIKQNLVNHELALQSVAKRNDELMTKYKGDIDGLFKEYDKEQNKSVREYAKMDLKLTEMELAKDRMQLDAHKFNAMSKQQAQQHNAKMAMENKKLSFKIKEASRSAEVLRAKRIANLVGGEARVTQNTAYIASGVSYNAAQNYTNAFTGLADIENPAHAQVAITNTGIVAREVTEQLTNMDMKDGEQGRAVENYTTLTNKSVLVPPNLVAKFLTEKRQIDTDTIVDVLRGTVAGDPGTNALIQEYQMKIPPTIEGQQMARAVGYAVTIHVLGSYADKARQTAFRAKKLEPATVDRPGLGTGDAAVNYGGLVSND